MSNQCSSIVVLAQIKAIRHDVTAIELKVDQTGEVNPYIETQIKLENAA